MAMEKAVLVKWQGRGLNELDGEASQGEVVRGIGKLKSKKFHHEENQGNIECLQRRGGEGGCDFNMRETCKYLNTLDRVKIKGSQLCLHNAITWNPKNNTDVGSHPQRF